MSRQPTKQQIYQIRAESQIEIFFDENNKSFMRLMHRPTGEQAVIADANPRRELRDKLFVVLFDKLTSRKEREDSILFRCFD